MKAIKKLNESLKYNIKINNRNVIAAICLMEFRKLRNHAINHTDDEILNRWVDQANRELHNNTPIKLIKLEYYA